MFGAIKELHANGLYSKYLEDQHENKNNYSDMCSMDASISKCQPINKRQLAKKSKPILFKQGRLSKGDTLWRYAQATGRVKP